MHPLKLKMHPFRKEPFDCIIFILQLDIFMQKMIQFNYSRRAA